MKSRIASGCMAVSVAFLAGCSSPGTITTATRAATSVYVVQTNSAAQYGTYISGQSDTIMQVSTSASGTVNPTSTISAPINYLIFGIALDGPGNIYASAVNVNTYVPEILVYAPGASGATTPLRILAGSATGLSDPRGMAVDASGQLYVLDGFAGPNGPAIRVFAAGANGNVAPVRIIQGSNTTLINPISLALDAAGNIYTVDGINAVNNPNYFVDVFSSTANGNMAPARTIRSSSSSGSLDYYGISLDTGGNIYVSSVDAAGNGTVTVFAAGSNGTVPPSKIIGGSGLSGMAINDLQVDSSGNVYAVGDGSSGYQVLSFAPSATDNVAPETRASVSGYTRTEFGTMAIH